MHGYMIFSPENHAQFYVVLKCSLLANMTVIEFDTLKLLETYFGFLLYALCLKYD